MPRDREKFLYDMLNSCSFLVELTADENIDRYMQDRMFRRAVERELQIVGEALMQLKTLDSTATSQISESDRIIGFRHVLVHGYDAIDADIVWFVVKEKIPILRGELEALLGNGS